MVLTRNQKRKRLLLVNGKDEPDNKRSRDDTSSESSVEAEHIPTSPVEEEERGTDDDGVDDEGVDDHESKMTKMGFMFLGTFVGVIALAAFLP